MVEGTSSLSLHAYGLAIDINPLYNPYLPKQDEAVVLPENASEYVDRSIECEYYIREIQFTLVSIPPTAQIVMKNAVFCVFPV